MARRAVHRDPSGLHRTTRGRGGGGCFRHPGLVNDGHSTTVKLYMHDGAINPDLTPTQRGKAMQKPKPRMRSPRDSAYKMVCNCTNQDSATTPTLLRRPGSRRPTTT